MSATAAVTAPQKPEWFASWFDSEHYHRLYANRDQHEAGAFVDRLIERLDPAPGAAMLDLGCGSGRHSLSLAAHGFQVTGIDLSAASLTLGASASRPVRAIHRAGHAVAIRRRRVRLRLQPLHQLRVLRRSTRSRDRHPQHRQIAHRGRHARSRLSQRPSCREESNRQ